ncbi:MULTISPECIES: GLUG motif-containing protein [unclassified Lentimicrobium]|uniref:InlB B-repeat-containing protein n=1 Tax=unclassified Lentimicrobium TaxID=2677434 RepID=UPI0015519B90|nr:MULTISPECIES: GLUG motif-containing protein [unclassified Lentimicrobium]NPD47893.1 T9SS type A sorting domain-containing protein [Lentimicrobium sp. S6]NPD86530.1 T9SS type A sorting domain-containing protein [Lentimicrobium sp. L6]
MKNLLLLTAVLFNIAFVFAQDTQDRGKNITDGSISTLADLQWLSENPDAWDENWVLEADIDASETATWNGGLGLSPIGDSPTEFGVRQQIPFSGTFDGQGYVISNITINRPSEPYVGFFGQTINGTVENLGLENITVNGYRYVGGLIGYSSEGSQIANCFTSATIEATEYGGGLIGLTFLNVEVSDSYSTGTVSVNKWGGGFVGDNYNYCHITNCWADVDVSGSDYLGGFASQNRWFSTINSCYSLGDVVATYDYSGGFVGINEDGVIRNSFSAGNITGSIIIGGFAGQSWMSENTETGIYSSYATGQVDAQDAAGGLIGVSYAFVNDCYFDIETTGTEIGIGNPDSGAEAIGLNTSDFAIESNFNNWDFSDVWTIMLLHEISPDARPYHQYAFSTTALYLIASPEEGGQLTGAGNHISGSDVQIEAIANANYNFLNWTDEDGNQISSDAITNITIGEDDISLIANFEYSPVYYSLSLSATPENSAILVGDGNYLIGEEVEISAEADGYYSFDNWTNESGDIISEDQYTTFVMPEANTNLVAHFHSTVGFEELENLEFSFYPNPANNFLNVDINKPAIISILNIESKVVLEQEISTKEQIDISNFNPGVYIISVKTQQNLKMTQLIIK